MIVKEAPIDIFKTKGQTITCPVNCYGTMGNGLALAFKNRYQNLDGYYKYLIENGLRVGEVHVFKVYDTPQQILLFPTKAQFWDDSKTSFIETGLQTLVRNYEALDIKELFVPALGCGKGNLDYERDVRPLLYQYLDPLPIPVTICLSTR